MGLGLHRARLVAFSTGHERKPRLDKRPLEICVHFKIAEKAFFHDVLAIEGMQIRTRANSQALDLSGELWRTGRAVRHFAIDGRDYDLSRTWGILSRICVGHADHVACDFDQCVLEASAGAKKWPVTAAGKLNPAQHSIEALIRAAGCSPEAIKGFQFLVERRIE